MIATKVIGDDLYLQDAYKSLKRLTSTLLTYHQDQSLKVIEDKGPVTCDESFTFLEFLERKFSNLSRPLTDIIAAASEKSENIAPGSLDLCGLFISSLSEEMIKERIHNKNKHPDQIEEEILKIKSTIESCSRMPLFSDLKSILKHRLPEDLFQLVLESILLTGITGKIFIENSPLPEPVVELKKGYNFDLETFPYFLKNKTWQDENVRVVVIDGIIENVSEIHHLLERASENIEPLVIFSRGLSHDVINTLHVNFLRKTLNIVPVNVPIVEEKLNMLKDIAVTCGTDVISSTKGDLISSIDFDEINFIEKISINESMVSIINDRAKSSVDLHTKNLIKRMKESANEAVRAVYSDRIKNLSSNCTIISLSGSDQKQKNDRYQIDVSLRMIMSIFKFGVVDLVKLKKVSNKQDNKILETFQNAIQAVFPDDKKLTTDLLISSLQIGTKTAFNISNTNSAIILDVS